MNLKSTQKYLLYLFSYLLIYPCSYPLLVMVLFACLAMPEKVADMVWYTFSIFVTIVGSLVLNIIFKRKMKLKKNTKQTLMIFFAHLILIPSTYMFGLWITTLLA